MFKSLPAILTRQSEVLIRTMSSSSPATPAPWRDEFVNHISQMPQATFTLSTLHPITSTTSNTAMIPRARTCIYRGLWGMLPENEKNPAERNPRVYNSDLPVFTTDARMDKVSELMSSGGRGSARADSGGGGTVEAVWWAEKAQTQWRVRGTAWVLGPDVDGDEGKKARDAIGVRLRNDGEGKEDQWSWAREVTAHFGNLSPVMRGTFRNPAPGTPRSVPGKEGEGLGQKVEDLDDRLARSNFRVCVIVPFEVDQVDLNPDEPRRWLYTFVGPLATAIHAGGEVLGEWERCEVWP